MRLEYLISILGLLRVSLLWADDIVTRLMRWKSVQAILLAGGKVWATSDSRKNGIAAGY